MDTRFKRRFRERPVTLLPSTFCHGTVRPPSKRLSERQSRDRNRFQVTRRGSIWAEMTSGDAMP